jgi:hypothetical protein
MPIVFEDVAPVVPVRDLQAALERYRQLGFEVRAYGHGTGYGYAQRGAVSIHLSEWDEHDPKRTGAVIYLYVSDADAVRAEWASCGVKGRLGEARSTDYGMRKFGFVDTDGTLHRVGSKLPQAAKSQSQQHASPAKPARTTRLTGDNRLRADACHPTPQPPFARP